MREYAENSVVSENLTMNLLTSGSGHPGSQEPWRVWEIWHRSEKKQVGLVRAFLKSEVRVEHNFHRSVNLFYQIKPDFIGFGYGGEALRAVILMLSEESGKQSVLIVCGREMKN